MSSTFTWGNEALRLHFGYGPDRPVTLVALLTADDDTPTEEQGGFALPVVEVQLAGDGRTGTTGSRHIDGTLSQRLRYLSHHEAGLPAGRRLDIVMADPTTGLEVTACYELYSDTPVLRAWSTLHARSSDVVVEHVSSFVFAGLAAACHSAPWSTDLEVWAAANPWSGEHRWSHEKLAAQGLVDVGMARFGYRGSKNRVSRTNVGSWSSSDALPMGCLTSERTNRAVLWQIEHNGSWHWELGDRDGEVYLLLSGPTAQEHQWWQRLPAGRRFSTVPVAVALHPDGIEGAAAAMTRYRRAIVRPSTDHRTLPVIFNDYMNCLMGDPSTAKLLPLVDTAAELGAEVFCIDAGWYADDAGWWNAVGAWEPSPVRFPGGLGEVIGRIHDAGMTPGLWLEPEVVGTRSPLADTLPDEAFFRRADERVVESGRLQLDLRHPAATDHLDRVVDRLVAEFGIGYLKLDYNIDIGAGSDLSGLSAGQGLLEHNRAYLDWLDRVLDRHPDLTIENCASGGMRTDYAMLSRLPIHSLTDQQDWRLMPPIAAAAPLAVLPEQGAVWAYPQPRFTPEQIAFTLATALLGRMHLSGRIDLLDEEQRELVIEAVRVYKDIRPEVAQSVPHWPLGLPCWEDGWVALALATPTGALLTVWRRDTADRSCRLPLPWLRGRRVTPRCLYPAGGNGSWTWDDRDAVLAIDLPTPFSARVLRLHS